MAIELLSYFLTVNQTRDTAEMQNRLQFNYLMTMDLSTAAEAIFLLGC
jgi:hypothetical protein